MNSPQTVLGQRYHLTERIAAGGMGEVWLAEDAVLSRPVAVKILRREYATDPTFLARFRNEARHAAGLSHPGVAAVYDFGEGAAQSEAGWEGTGSPYLVMEYVPGEPLSAVVAREGRLPPARALDVVGQAAFGLQAAHEAGVVHRDVKPGNILLTPDGIVKVTDFGIARATNAVPLTRTGTILGTAWYLSPEQASGRPVTPASDVYSLGVVAYECLTGNRPFDGDTPVHVALAQVNQQPPALPDDLPAPVRELVLAMLAKDPADRPASAGDLGRAALALAAASTAAATVPATAAATVAATQVLSAGPAPDPVVPAPAPGPPGHPSGAAPPGRLTDTNPGFRLPAPAGRPWLPYAVALGVLAVALLGVLRACGADPAGPGPAGAASAARPQTPRSVEVRAADYRDRPLADVRRELTRLGLRVHVARVAGGGPVGTVTDVSPTGSRPAGSRVTVTVATAAEPAGDEGPGGDDREDGNGRSRGTGRGERGGRS